MMRKKDATLPIDGPHFITGLLTMFKQFHPSFYKKYIVFLVHYFKNLVPTVDAKGKIPEKLPHEAYMTLAYLDELIKFEGQTREVISQLMGTFVFDCYSE